ncbi:cell envelope biogenesis protein TolA, partial [Sphingomonas sp. 2SG]|uniref:cell envelope biogenesis protein TolA n=1 Tax=Sphingomonas sp. 2SG TaxID=2502201 RepID=UPI0010F5A8CB
PAPEPEPAPPAPAPKPAPAKPAPPKPAPPKPAPAPAPKPAPVKPQPKPRPAAEAPAKPSPKPAPAKQPAKPAKAAPEKPAAKAPAAPAKTAGKPSTAPAKPAAAKGSGSSESAKTAKPRGSRLGSDFLAGLTSDPSPSKSTAPRAAKIDGRAMASIVQAIARQIQPCADRQVNPGPGANEIVTTLNLRLNEDGTLAATPRMVRQSGVTDENERYKQRVVDLGVAAFKGCAPLKLPAEYYSTPSGGWNNINFQWKLQ